MVMRGSKPSTVLLLFSLVCTHLCSALVIRVSKTKGRDCSSCLVSHTSCRTIAYALGALDEKQNGNETIFTVYLEDEVYHLANRTYIYQTNRTRSVHFKSGILNSRVIIRCVEESAGIEIGTRHYGDRKTRNIYFDSLEFHQCGPRFAAVVLVWNSVDVTFTNCGFKNNTQAGINAFDSGVTIENCSFVNNTSNAANETEVYIKGNISAGGGAGFMYHNAENLSVIINKSLFESNTVVTSDTDYFIAPSYNVSDFTYAGGGMIVLFQSKAKRCHVVIENSVFLKNSATHGGGLFLADENMALGNDFTVINSNFSRNYAGQSGGGLVVSQWDNSSNLNVVFKNCQVNENWARRGAGMNVFLMYRNIGKTDSMLRFDSVAFSNNQGFASTAIRFTTALPFGSTVGVTPEFVNCTIRNHIMKNNARTSPFTSQRVNLKFTGTNVFVQNSGGGAAAFQDCVVFVHGRMTFANNSGSNGGAMFVLSSQIKLFPGSELVFLGNTATGLGGAIFVLEHLMDEFIHANNPNCFLASTDPLLPPSKWNVHISFIENSSRWKGSAIYLSSLRRCVWNEQAPYYDPHKALRWSTDFVYRNNSLIWDDGIQLTGPKYDIATDTKGYRFAGRDNSTLKLSPGESSQLNLQAIDELGHEVITTIFASVSQVNCSSKVWLKDVLYVLFPNKNMSFSFHQPQESYKKTKECQVNKKRMIQLVDPYSTLMNGDGFELELEMCHPGFVFSNIHQRCICDKNVTAIERCENGRTVFLKEGYWANVTNGKLLTYFCPVKYCKCQRKGDLPGCFFDPQKSNNLCAKNREGWLCGKCSGNNSVALRRTECTKCKTSGWILALVIPVVVGLWVLVIWLNPSFSSELRGPLFFFQALPYIFDPASQLGDHVTFASNLFNFGGPFIFIFDTCIIKGLDNLYAIAFGYLIPLSALIVFLLAYCLSANYYLKFKFRSRSMLQSFWLLLLFIYSYLVETSFLILFCPKVGDKYVFFYDGTLQCFHGHHLPFGIIAVFVLVFLVIPPPIMVVLLTNGYWRVDPQYISTLTDSLRPECRWWWSVDMIRRIIVVATYAFVPIWEIKKILLIFVCVVLLTIHSNFQPYERRRANIAESLYLMVLCTLAIMQEVNYDNVKYYVCLGLLIIASLHTVLVFFCKAVRFFPQRFDCCAFGQETAVQRSGFEELENTHTDSTMIQNSESERQRNILDAIISSSIERSELNSSGFKAD